MCDITLIVARLMTCAIHLSIVNRLAGLTVIVTHTCIVVSCNPIPEGFEACELLRLFCKWCCWQRYYPTLHHIAGWARGGNGGVQVWWVWQSLWQQCNLINRWSDHMHTTSLTFDSSFPIKPTWSHIPTRYRPKFFPPWSPDNLHSAMIFDSSSHSPFFATLIQCAVIPIKPAFVVSAVQQSTVWKPFLEDSEIASGSTREWAVVTRNAERTNHNFSF